jgi:hypothetical protein
MHPLTQMVAYNKFAIRGSCHYIVELHIKELTMGWLLTYLRIN